MVNLIVADSGVSERDLNERDFNYFFFNVLLEMLLELVFDVFLNDECKFFLIFSLFIANS